eukprot:gb/GECG01007021.1/.p1 GENE.gb/GECG01007021.1/~~gb/GECG01007021.1/.p1  ORF type:complete len:186 (+),score=9.91 gb/GECG01007021.1/:1-558(+)
MTSLKKPTLAAAGKSSADTPVLKVAIDRNTYRSDMKVADKTFLKLREWKARLLAEPPPLVEIESFAEPDVYCQTRNGKHEQFLRPEEEKQLHSDETNNRLRFARARTQLSEPLRGQSVPTQRRLGEPVRANPRLSVRIHICRLQYTVHIQAKNILDWEISDRAKEVVPSPYGGMVPKLTNPLPRH